jgi:hypothetical protein
MGLIKKPVLKEITDINGNKFKIITTEDEEDDGGQPKSEGIKTDTGKTVRILLNE